ncbi:MAG: cob(I)yrinic acid a,c-diamide adenosyltransferase [Desulfomonilaceae bacterium]|nr:cob(I)yrinic acid a,c-diamide adenosyltransferase [Desulfomonilaceae bacterium]
MAEGLLMVYTGTDPENHYSPAGQYFRALGRGLRVCVIEFVARENGIGVSALQEAFEGRLKYHAAGPELSDESNPVAPRREQAVRALRAARDAIESGEFDMVLLDRLLDLTADGLVDSAEVMDVLSKRPPNLHIIVSGHSSPDELLQAADLVTHTGNTNPGISN